MVKSEIDLNFLIPAVLEGVPFDLHNAVFAMKYTCEEPRVNSLNSLYVVTGIPFRSPRRAGCAFVFTLKRINRTEIQNEAGANSLNTLFVLNLRKGSFFLIK